MSKDERLKTPMPLRIARLGIESRGYPITYLAAYINGRPDLGVQDPQKFLSCVNESRCHVCGEKIETLGYFIAYEPIPKKPHFLDPAIHRECALYSLQVCPYLANPKAKHRSAKGLNVDKTDLGVVGERGYEVVLLGATGQKMIKVKGQRAVHLGVVPTSIATREKIDIRDLVAESEPKGESRRRESAK